MKNILEKFPKDMVVTEDGEDEHGRYKIPYKLSKNYKVYEDGRVFSESKCKFLNEEPLKHGDRNIRLYIPKRVTFKVGDLVALLYLPYPEDKSQRYVIYKDDNRENTHYTNLKWHNEIIILDSEEFKPLPKYPGYVADRNGNIYHKEKGVLNIRKPQVQITGYHTISIGNKPHFVHRLVYSAFYPDIDIKGLEIDHINRTRGENKIDNLRTATRHEQVKNMKPRKSKPWAIIKCSKDGDILEFYKDIESAMIENNIDLSETKFREIIRNKGIYNENMWAYKNKHYKPKEGEMCKEMIYKDFGDKIEFPGYYIYSSGVIVNTNRNNYYVFYPHSNEVYPYIDIKGNKFVIHRRLAIFFIPGRTEEKHEVHHKDENKNNYSLDNLEWTSPSDNITATCGKLVKQLHPETGEVLAVFPSATTAQKSGPRRSKVLNCCHGDRNISGDFRWEFCSEEEYHEFIENNDGKNSKDKEYIEQIINESKKYIKQIHPETKEVLAVFDSLSAAQKAGPERSKIGLCCNKIEGEKSNKKTRNEAGGFLWKTCFNKEYRDFIDNNDGKNMKDFDFFGYFTFSKKITKQIDPKTEKVLRVFKTASDAGKFVPGASKAGVRCKSNITDNGKRQAGGFIWKYCSIEESKIAYNYFEKNKGIKSFVPDSNFIPIENSEKIPVSLPSKPTLKITGSVKVSANIS